jgi:hypothetical protein
MGGGVPLLVVVASVIVVHCGEAGESIVAKLERKARSSVINSCNGCAGVSCPVLVGDHQFGGGSLMT